jgi:hypothetical protein
VAASVAAAPPASVAGAAVPPPIGCNHSGGTPAVTSKRK